MKNYDDVMDVFPKESVCVTDDLGLGVYVESRDMFITITSDSIDLDKLISVGNAISSLREIIDEIQTLRGEKLILLETVSLLSKMLGDNLGGEVEVTFNDNKEEL
jgi:hypothetical protein